MVRVKRKRVWVAGLTHTLRKVIGMDGLEWFPRVGVSCLRCNKQGEVCYLAPEMKRVEEV